MKANFFSRLLEVARSSRIRKVEDYATEILCRAIMDDPTPIIAIIEKLDLLFPNERITRLSPYTQYPVKNGRIDLCLQLETNQDEIDLLFEIKVNCPESGNQIDKYLEYIKHCHKRTSLLSIGKTILRKDVPNIFWQQIWDAISESNTSSALWLELKYFLRDIYMADEFNKAISINEVNSFSSTFGLLQKSWHALQPVATHANNIWSYACLPTDPDKILSIASSQFMHNRFTLYTSSLNAYLVLGFAFYENELNLATWVETSNPRKQWIRDALISKASQAGLSDSWLRVKDLKRWDVLLTKEPIRNEISIDYCSSWLIGKINQLNETGILDFIPSLKKA